ncbi:MAG: DUF3459 domain-containing protein [Acidobacteriota bacterium]|nr:DUF3459 domain-containing protein [Acidobacteriota bacterium]
MQTAPWWQTAVLYQVYPRSFQDANGDGVGDLQGILARLDSLVELGVDALWLSPIYPSPMADFGYDVANYCDVDPLFGSLADFDTLLEAAHARGLRLVLDLVPNHTSSQHPWFVASRSSRRDPHRDWYLWHDPAPGGGPPNNWTSHFGGSAWTLDQSTGQYYLHSFLPEQPDLNWRNPEVRAAIYSAMRFWLERGTAAGGRGVDGFRVDVLWLLIKDALFRDNPANPAWDGALLPLYTADRPEVHAIVGEMRSLLEEYGDRVLIGEIYLPLRNLMAYYGFDPASQSLRGAHLPFNFHLIHTPWQAEAIAQLVMTYEALLPPGAWPNWVLGNHDQHRLATRLGPYQIRTAAMLLLTLRGTPTLYYGDELGMPDGHLTPEQQRDPAGLRQPGAGRDAERTPMLWDGSPHAGFSPVEPWLPVHPEYPQTNANAQAMAPRSVLSLYRQLLRLRRAHPALHCGSVTTVSAQSGVLGYQRHQGEDHLQIYLNLTEELQSVTSPRGTILLTTILDGAGGAVEGTLYLEPGEGLLIQLG